MNNIVHKLNNIVQNIVHIKQVEKLYNRKMGLKTKLYKVVYNIVHFVKCCTIIYVILYNLCTIFEKLCTTFISNLFVYGCTTFNSKLYNIVQIVTQWLKVLNNVVLGLYHILTRLCNLAKNCTFCCLSMVDMRNGSDHCVELGNEGVIWSVLIVGFWRPGVRRRSCPLPISLSRPGPGQIFLAARPRPDDDLN